MKNITKETWQENVYDQPLVLVDFWASWCQPCKAMLPILEELERDVALLTVVKINADENPNLVEELGIKSIPTMILYKNGEHIWTKTGAKPKADLLKDVIPYV
jgi:thioredoxin 1